MRNLDKNNKKEKNKHKLNSEVEQQANPPRIQDKIMMFEMKANTKNKKKQEQGAAQRENKHRINSADEKNTNTPKISNQAKKL